MTMRQSPLIRQWSILRRLAVAGTGGVKVQDLAKDLECVPRTVYRDLLVLQAAGFPLESHKVDVQPGENRRGWFRSWSIRHTRGVAELAKIWPDLAEAGVIPAGEPESPVRDILERR